jgi:hypothetical protein
LKVVPESSADSPPSLLRREVRSFIELFALCGFALAYPLLDLYGRAPEQFVFRSAEARQIIGFALAVTLVPPVVLWAFEAVVGIVARPARRGVHVTLVALLVAIFAVQALRPFASGLPLMLMGALLGIGAALLYLRLQAVRLWLSFAAAAPLLFVALFLTASDTSRLLSSDATALAGTRIGNPVPVVVVVFDELPLVSLLGANGEIDGEIYPNFEALAGESHWFRNTTTVSTSTWHAVPAIASGKFPGDDQAPVAADHPENLFTLLAESYDLQVTESITRLCPSDLCAPPAHVPAGLRMILSDATQLMRSRLSPSGHHGDVMAGFVEAPLAEPTAEDADGDGGDENTWDDFHLNQPARVRSLLDGIDAASGTRPQLHYLHLLLPHVPFRYLPSGAQYPAPDVDRDDDTWIDEPWPVSLAHQRHLLQVAYVDSLVGELVRSLKERAIYDEALVIVTSDHGISFQPGRASRGIDEVDEGPGIDEDLLPELMWVPLFVKLPGQQSGEVSDVNLSTVDIVPTIADVLEVEIPWEVDGQSAFGVPRTDATKTFFRSYVTAVGVSAGERVEIDATTLVPRLAELGVDRILPARGDQLRMWRSGPRAAVVGTRIDELPADQQASVEVDLDYPEDFAEVDPRTGTVPAIVSGRVPSLQPGQAVAVAVNGMAAATSPVFEWHGNPSFSVVVSEQWFRTGENHVTVHRLAR